MSLLKIIKKAIDDGKVDAIFCENDLICADIKITNSLSNHVVTSQKTSNRNLKVLARKNINNVTYYCFILNIE
jgi:hypothetical protein